MALRRFRRAGRAGEAGFTLIELLVVLAIIGLLASLTAPRVIKYLGGAKTQTAEVRLQTLATALDLYRLEVGRYPSEQEGLAALLEKPQSAARWNGPYVNRPQDLNDPWNQPFVYRFPGRHSSYDLASLGADGAEGGEGEDRDVVNW
jgi:general secretion pathway protein G